MTTAAPPTVETEVRRIQQAVLASVLADRRPITIVDSPPGAGKTSLVEAVIAVAVHHFELRVVTIAPRAEQTYDLVRRLRDHFRPMPTVLLQSSRRPAPSDLQADPGVGIVADPTQLSGRAGVTIANAAKLIDAAADLADNRFDLLVCDEAYQLTFADLAPLTRLAPSVLLVGDPGQLPPLVRVDTAAFEAARYRVHWPAPKELLRLSPDLRPFQLPASHRLPQSTVDLVQPAFYPQLPFVSAAPPASRRVAFGAAGLGDAVDRALDHLAAGASLIGVVLPRTSPEQDDVDEELAQVAAAIGHRALERGATWIGHRRLTERDLGYVDAHVASGAATGRALRARGLSGAVMVDTPEIWQGLQRPLTIVKHPLSGTATFSPFSLDPGRLCVMTSRHLLGCVIVARDGIDDDLLAYHHDCGARPSGSEDATWDGWRAHRALWLALDQRDALHRL